MTKKPKQPAETSEPTCGQCKHWRGVVGDEAFCHFNPPKMEFDDDGQYFLSRPILDRTEIACGRFTGAN